MLTGGISEQWNQYLYSGIEIKMDLGLDHNITRWLSFQGLAIECTYYEYVEEKVKTGLGFYIRFVLEKLKRADLPFSPVIL